jgi:hypothetical protein
MDEMPSTWKEFKELVEKQMKELGLSEDTELNYIDLSFPADIDVFYDKDSGMSI